MPGPCQLHEGLIEVLRRQIPGAQTGGWMRQLRSCVSEFIPDSVDPENDLLPNRKPDLFAFDPVTQAIQVWEVEVNGPLDGDRLLEWGQLWFLFDSYCWELKVSVLDRLGRVTEVDLPLIYYAGLSP